MKSILAPIVISLLFFAACGSPSTTEPAQPTLPPPTSKPAATQEPATLEPSETPTQEPTATPEGVLFRDDFSGELQTGWTWENENPSNWRFTEDGWLEITGEDGFMGGPNPQSNVLIRDLPAGEVMITVHLRADPVANFQQAAIWLWQDQNNFLDLNRGYCNPCSFTKDTQQFGSGIYQDYHIPGLLGTFQALADQADVYLRIVIDQDAFTTYYALQPDQWTRLGRFDNLFTFSQIRLGVSNLDPFGIDANLVGAFDWIEISILP
jgi:hypothetical protein